ncbi:MAG: hypothetical protein ACLQOO_03510 [Terriglobia bacterium]
MPNAKRARRTRAPREMEPPPVPPPIPPLIPPLMQWWLRSLLSGIGRPGGRPLPRFRRSQKHLLNAAIEVLEGMRACLDETIEWLHDERGPAELKKIKVE